MYMALNISKPTAFCKYYLAVLPRLISRPGHYSVQPKKKKKEKARGSGPRTVSEAAGPGTVR